jgi:hypothetical protein
MLIVAVAALILLGLIALAVLAHLIISVVNSYTSALSVSTPRAVIPDILSALNLPIEGNFMEPGCGDARVLAAVVLSQPGINAVGIDNNPVILALAKIKLHGQATLVCGDLTRQDFTSTQRVFAYLSPKMMEVLSPVFSAQLQPGARVVSLQFPLPGRTAIEQIELAKGRPHARTLYIYDY